MRRLSLAVAMAITLASVPAHAAEVPRSAPQLIIKLPDGSRLSLSEFKGKVVALEFLLTYCPQCQRASSVMNTLQKELGPKGFQALGVAVDPGAYAKVPDYVKQLGLLYPVGSDSHHVASSFLQISMNERMLMPQLVFIDRQGVVRAQYAGDHPFFDKDKEEANMRAQVLELLNEGGSAKGAEKKK